jgi:hypothetical protein
MVDVNQNKIKQDQGNITIITHQSNSKGISKIIYKFRTITRLIIGSLVFGIDTLSDGMDDWESSVDNNIRSANLESIDINESESQSSAGSNQNEIRYAMVGLLFKSQDQIETGLNAVDKVSRKLSDIASPMIRPVANSRLAKPFQNKFSELVSRGEDELGNWIAIGKNEEVRSKKIVETAANDQVDNVMLYLAEKPEVQEIIQGQSIGLASEIIEEIRERAVSADNLLEGFIRITLRLKSRSELPEPPKKVQARAILGRQTRGKSTPYG